jgi:PAS domain S-box-containing protein
MSGNFIIKKILECENKLKIAVMAVILVFCCFLIYYFHEVLHKEVLYTHFFYIPIILSAVWWKRKGLVVTFLLSAVLLITHFDGFGFGSDFIDDVLRVFVFIIVGIMVVYLKERIDKQIEEIGVSSRLIRENEEKFRLIVDSSNSLIYAINPMGVVTFINDKIKDYGYEPKEVMGKAISNFCHSKDLELAFEGIERLLETGGVKERLSIRFKRKDGTFFYGEQRHGVVYKNGEVDSIICNMYDITEKKKHKSEKEILQKKLIQSEKMEALGSFVGGIAHDFNNLLMPILSVSEFSKDDISDKNKVLDNFNEIKKSALRGKKLVSRLLAFSREQSLEFKIVNLNDLLLNIEKLLKPLIGENIELKCIFDKTIGNIKVDVSQIEQIILNLAANARDAMPKGGKFTIETSNTSIEKDYADLHKDFKAGAYILLTVSDSGSGMDKKTLEQIFNPFFTTKEKDKGTGLGLATVYGIVKQLGGNISVYSEVGHGTTFRIYFKQTAGKAVKIESDRIQINPKSLKGAESILMVEDDESVMKVGKRMLKQYGYNVFCATDAQEAKKIFQEHEDIQFLFTDIMLTGSINGRDLAKELKAVRPEIKVLFMSGYTDGILLKDEVEDKDINFIQKPFGYKEIGIKIREVLDSK